jgi:Zn-dependent metalloprotease
MFTRSKVQKFISILFIWALLLSSVHAPDASAQGGDGLKRQRNSESGNVSFIGPESGRVVPAYRALGTFIRPQDPAMALAKRFAPEFGIKDAARELTEIRSNRPGDGRVTARYQQEYQGIPVMGGELIVNTNDNGDLYSMNGEVSPNLSLQTQPKIDSAQAAATALQALAKWYEKTPADFSVSQPELWIFDESLLRPSTRAAELVWRMEVTPKELGMPVRELILVNAERGNISLHFNQVDTAWTGAKTLNQNEVLVVEAFSPSGSDIGDNPVIDLVTTANMPALVPVTWYVATTGNDSNSCTSTDSPCLTINGAIGKTANGDTINVATGTYTSSGTEVVLINKSITLSGGWNASFTTQSGISTIDGQDMRRGVTVNSGFTATLEQFVVQNGNAYFEAGISNSGTLTVNNSIISFNKANYNGGIGNFGTMTLNNSTVSGNSAILNSQDGGNGGIANDGIMTLNNSTVSGNSATYNGGIANSGTMVLNNSTISGNSATYNAGITNSSPGTMTLNNSTVSGNTSASIGGIFNYSGTLMLNNSTVSGNSAASVGGIYRSAGTVTLKNTLLAGNSAIGGGPDCFGSIGSNGYNLIGNNSGCTFSATTGDLVGTSTGPINPRLTLLQDNGGLTFTHALITGSPAITAGSPAVPGSGGTACLATDQRGVARPVGAGCDIGAYEGSVQWAPPYLVSTYTTGSTSSLPGSFLCDQTDPTCFSGDFHAKMAHKYAIGTYNFYAAKHGRDSIDNAGMTIISTVQYCDPDFPCPYDNAFWSGTQIVYGSARGWPLADDVVAHELTHGVTQHESNLFYYYQSGAINESFSDLWGEYYDQTNGLGSDAVSFKWLISEDISNNGSGAIRSMSNPPAYGDPDMMTSNLYYNSDSDNGGVHSNSGINNKAVYLMVDGGSFNGKTVTALGWDKTAAIYYEVNTNLLTSGSNYSDLYYALQAACKDLTGQLGITSGDCDQVKNVLDAVEMNSPAYGGFYPDAPVCASGQSPTNLFQDNFESGTGNWDILGSGQWSLEDWYATSATHMMWGDDYSSSSDSRLTMKNGVYLAPGTSPSLHFRHAFLFEYDSVYYDGGVLEYSTNNGASWTDSASLFSAGKNYNGVLNATPGTSNTLAGRSAFAGDSHGYVSSQYNLSSLAGQTVKFRWRFATDQYVGFLGWVLDDVKIYTCAMDIVAPTVTSIVHPVSANPNLLTTDFVVTFSESVTGVSQYDFVLTTTGVTGASIVGVSGSGATYTVTVHTGVGNGTIRVDAMDNDSISDGAGHFLGGAGTGNGNFTSGEVYTTNKTLEVYISANPIGAYSLTSGLSQRASYPGANSGPVKMISLNATSLIGAERVIYKVNGIHTSFSEMMALPDSQLDTTYWLPWYNNVDLDTQLRFGNVSGSPATVQVFIGGQEISGCSSIPSTPYPYVLADGASLRVSCAGINNGPVQIQSTGNVVAAERVIYKVNGIHTSFSEMMALPDSQLNTTYWLPWYNNVDLDTQLRFGVP